MLWNCIRPGKNLNKLVPATIEKRKKNFQDQLWCLNPKKIVEKFPPLSENQLGETEFQATRSSRRSSESTEGDKFLYLRNFKLVLLDMFDILANFQSIYSKETKRDLIVGFAMTTTERMQDQ